MKGVLLDDNTQRYVLSSSAPSTEFAKEMNIDVNNRSVFGCTVAKGSKLVNSAIEKGKVGEGYVLIEYGGNDCNFNWEAVSNNPEGEFLPNTEAEKFSETYLEMINFAREKGATVVVCNLVPIDSPRFMNWVSQGLSYENILKWMGDVNRIARWQEYYSHLAEKVARIAKCPILDLRTSFLTHDRMEKMIGIDGIHPSAEGHSLISTVFQKGILDGAF
jgi:lysophospholipase L1-like esterase